MVLPIDRTTKTTLDSNLVNGITSDAPTVKASNDNVYNTIDELNSKVDTHSNATVLAHPDGSVTTAKISNLAVTTAKIADANVTTTKVADLNITTAKLADSAVTAQKLATSAVGTTQLADGSVTPTKIPDGTLTASKFVAGALTNDTQNGLAITALQADVVQRGINLKSAPYNAKCDGVTDDTVIFQQAIDDMVAAGGGYIIIPSNMKITGTIYFSGYIAPVTTYPDLPKVFIVGINNARIISTLPSGSVFKMGRPTVKMQFRLVLKDITIDANNHNVTIIDGWSQVEPNNVLVDMIDVTITGHSGAAAIGIDCGDMTDCSFLRVRIQGNNGWKGFVPRRSNCKLIDCIIQYHTHGVYIPLFGEAAIQMVGGQIIYNTNQITFQGGGYTYNVNTLHGVFIGESQPGCKILNWDSEVATHIHVINFFGCHFDIPASATNPLMRCATGGVYNFIGCENWYQGGATQVRAEQFAEVNMIGNGAYLTLDPTSPGLGLANRLFKDVGGDVNATGGFKQTISFFQNAVAASQGGNLISKNAGTVKEYLMSYSGSLLAIGIDADTARTAGNVTVQIAVNGSGISGASSTLDATNTQRKYTTFTKDTYKFNAGDRISVFVYSSSDWAPTTANIGVDVVIEY